MAFALAIAVHAAFIAVLVFSVRWQNAPPEPVTAELYAPPAKAPVQETPVPPPESPPAGSEPAPAAKPDPMPEPPPKPAAGPETEKPDPQTAAIALRAKQEEERRKREAIERERQEREKKVAEKKKIEEQKRVAEIRERQSREAEALRVQAEREKAEREKGARDAQQTAVAAETAARSRAEADYIRRIQSKVKGNVILPPEMAGNPEAIFEVVQLPTGEIIDAVLKKSSGVRAYDDAVQRAIVKSSPLPRPDRPDLFQRALTLKFRPQD
jgi:colicin import membrane protein